jgi:acyl-coenzyme A synthetase/AMP-(fatty) acid ligase
MNRDQVMQMARDAGLVVEPCVAEDFISIRVGEAPAGTSERMRLTADGALMIVNDGYYWQVGSVDDVASYVRSLP